MILHCWSHVLLCWGLCLIVDSFVPVQWMPNCFFQYKSGCYKWVDCLIVIISTCYFQQQQSVCHLPDQMFVQFLTVPCYLLAGSWMQNWGRVLSNKRAQVQHSYAMPKVLAVSVPMTVCKGSSFKMSSRVLFWIFTVFRVLFRLTLLTFKAELHQDETQLKPFCSIRALYSSHCCTLQLFSQHAAAHAADFLCSSHYACMGTVSQGALFLFMVWLLRVVMVHSGFDGD